MDESIKFDFSGKSTEEVLSLFFHEVKSPIQIMTGHLIMLNKAELSEDDSKKFIEIALKAAMYVQKHTTEVIQYLEKQEKY